MIFQYKTATKSITSINHRKTYYFEGELVKNTHILSELHLDNKNTEMMRIRQKFFNKAD